MNVKFKSILVYLNINEQLKKRIKGFLWSMFNVVWVSAVLAGLNHIVDVVPTLGLSDFLTMTIIMMATQCTKYLNKK